MKELLKELEERRVYLNAQLEVMKVHGYGIKYAKIEARLEECALMIVKVKLKKCLDLAK